MASFRNWLPKPRVRAQQVTALALLLWAGCRSPLPSPQRGEVRPGLRERMYLAEDRRGRGPEGLQPLLEGLAHPDPLLRAQAARALGRLEDPSQIARLMPLLGDKEVRDEAVFALAQALQSREVPPPPELVDSVAQALMQLAGRYPVSGVLLRSVARLPYRDSLAIASAVRWLVAMGTTRERGALAAVRERQLGVAHGFFTLARRHRGAVAAEGGAVSWLRQVAGSGSDPEGMPVAPQTRRLAWLALAALQWPGLDGEAVQAWEAGDWQVKRPILQYLALVRDSQVARLLLDRARRDPDFHVRYEWVRAYRRMTAAAEGCGPLLEALSDPSPHVQLAAVDALDAGCERRSEVALRLRALVEQIPVKPDREPGRASWHLGARALVRMADVDASQARVLVRRAVGHPVWQVRMYAARAAALLADEAALMALARDTVGSVREAALSGLAQTVGHRADSSYLAALQSPHYHVVLAAATALRGSPRGRIYLEPVLAALERLTRERRETSRDPRLALLELVGEWGAASDVELLGPYLADFDLAVAARTARLLQRLAPERGPFLASPRPEPQVEEGLARVAMSGPVRLQVVMAPESGGGAFVLCICQPAATPATAARILRLVRSGYYDGLSWHRVVPNFVIQGGSPGMNEYAGDGPFMRDEIGEAMHLRGTVGISTRGRDTGDAQLFVNLVDNYRLDYEYTTFAVVESGMEVVDGILEGDRILAVRILASRPSGDRGR